MLKAATILKSYSFDFEINCTSQEVNLAIQESIAENVLQKFVDFKKENLGLSRPNVSGRFSDWANLSQEAGLGGSIGLDMNNINQAMSTVPEKISSDVLINFNNRNSSISNIGLFIHEEMSSHCNALLDQQMQEKVMRSELDSIPKVNLHFSNIENTRIDLNKDNITKDFMNTRRTFPSETVSVLGMPIPNIQYAETAFMDFELSKPKTDVLICDDMLATTNLNFNLDVTLESCGDLDDQDDDIRSDTTFIRKMMKLPPRPQSCSGKQVDGQEGVSPQKPRFVCSACGKGFNHKASLDDHVTKHTGDYKYSCDKCTKYFASKWKLNAHMHTHQEPRYNCAICNKKFVRRSSCNDHEKTHGTEKLFTCCTCGSTFKCLKYLKRHEQVDTST